MPPITPAPSGSVTLHTNHDQGTARQPVRKGIEHAFDVPFIAALALKEKQIQQNYRPIIAVHKWFARRPGTLFRGLLLAEFGDRPLADAFYDCNDFPGLHIADPFMGGGTPIIEANRIGCDCDGFDLNPMSAWIVREEIEHIDLDAYTAAAAALTDALSAKLGPLYRTDCPLYGDRDVPVKYFVWVKVLDCAACGLAFDLFPGYLLAEDRRHPRNVLVCPSCGELNETVDRKNPGTCHACATPLHEAGPARRNRCRCPHCGHVNSYPRPASGPPRHRLFALEYFNPARKSTHAGRFFKKPDHADLERTALAEAQLARIMPRFIPPDVIPPGDETDRLHRWGYNHYRDLFNARQLLALESSARHIAAIPDMRIRNALATNFSDLLRYQNLLCRYDTMALKSLDIFSVHGFPVGLVHCESNVFGIRNEGGAGVGSGGWVNIIDKYGKAKRYCDAPFEVRHQDGRKVQVPITGEWIGERRAGEHPRRVRLHCASSTGEGDGGAATDLSSGGLDAVFTDPPYFGNVQYAELMDFCYVWLRRLVGTQWNGFDRSTTRSDLELTGNATRGRGLTHFAEGLAAVYARMAQALKPGAPLAFTYHHNQIEPYYAVGCAILDAGLVCSASLPCPAEMGGSIHIHGTGSSIIDTILVCRGTGVTRRRWLFSTSSELAAVVAADLEQLTLAGRVPTAGDTRCICFGHLTRMAIWQLRQSWNRERPMRDKLACFSQSVTALGHVDEILRLLDTKTVREPRPAKYVAAHLSGLELDDAIPF
jgi:putative DNA methylase